MLKPGSISAELKKSRTLEYPSSIAVFGQLLRLNPFFAFLMARYTAFELATYLFQNATEDPIKIQKLLYISFGFYGVLNRGVMLFDEEIQAWTYGPVIPDVYTYQHRLPFQPPIDLDPKTKRILDRVIATYGKKHPFDLVHLTHQPNTPWSLFYQEGANNEIPKGAILDHYSVVLKASIVMLSGNSRRIMEDFARR